MSFSSTLFPYHIEEPLEELKSCLYQLAYSTLFHYGLSETYCVGCPGASMHPGTLQSGSYERFKGSGGSWISRECNNLMMGLLAVKIAMSGSWPSKLNIVLPWQVATTEILLERNQNPNRSGKSLASRAFGSQFLLFIPGLFSSCCWPIYCWVFSGSPKAACIKMSTFVVNWRSK